MSTRDLIEGEAELDDEEGEESFDEETGEVRERRNGGMNDFDDSSEEEDDDDDEEAARAVREGFIVDEDEDEEEREQRRRARKKRRREEREQEDAVLDEEDLDLIGEANPDLERVVAAQQSKFKRLKRGHKEDRGQGISNGIEDIFSDDEEETPADYADRRAPREGRRVEDEFADFIEEDEFDDEERGQVEEDLEVRAPTSKKRFDGVAIKDATGLDDLALEDMRRAFGDGTEYDWALEQEAEMEEDEMDPDQPLELKDVFEPSQLVEKMLTDEDNEIRQTDEPERFQIARKPYKHIVLTDEQFKEEATWISNLMLPRKRLDRDLHEPFQRSVAKVLEFMTTDDYEVPFIFQHRKDYLIHASKIAVTPDPLNPAAPEYTVSAEKLLNQTDLWDIFDMDLKFRALVDKRNALQRTYDNLKDVSEIHDPVFEDMLPAAVTMEELQDIQDYLHFQYSSQIKDLNTMNGETNGTHRRPGAGKTIFDRIRNGKVYNLVRAFGLSADAFAQNALKEGRRQYTEDPNVLPDDMADGEDLIDPPEFSTGAQVLKSAKMMFAEEIANNPKMRKVMRRAYYQAGVIDCFRTEKGLRRIDEQHPYYEFKYLRNQPFSEIARQPDLLLKMLKAEEDGLVEVRVRLEGYDGFKDKLFNDLASDNFSEIADAWNRERREVLDLALSKLERIMAKGVKENMKTECENQVAKACREEFTRKLDQAPYKPKGMVLGTVPRVLALSNGQGNTGRDAVCWAWVEEDGRVLENGKFSDLRLGAPDTEIPDSEDVNNFKELVQRRKPDVIAVSGFSVQTKVLTSQLQEIVDRNDLTCPEYEDEDGNEKSEKLEVIIVNDEVARLYQTSDRAAMEYPALAPLTRYCVALAKYVQNPMKEYAALGRDIVSISFHPSQQLLPQDKVIKQLETAMVDMVNLVGVNINDAVSELYTANLLQYVSGLGPRKAQQLLKAVNINGGVVTSRAELVGDPEEGKLPAVGPRVWNNCASFVYIDYESSEDVDYLDNTRVHPEDYDLGRKMAADALELDEEDIKAETDENGHGAIVRKLIKDEAQEKVNDLILEEYAEQLERNFNQRKRATLETIRAELQQPYEELRRDFGILSSDEIFTMFTGETRDSLCDGMIVPMVIRRVTEDHLDGRLDCGIGAVVMASEAPAARDVSLRQMFSMHQTVQAKVLYLDRKKFDAQLSLREEELRRPYRKHHDRMRDEWDYGQEERDKEALQEKNKETGRTQRVVRHPLFRAFNSAQAEEFLGSQARGDVVIRPSSKGMDHLAVTWKVSDNVYQHIDVLELDKDNEFAVGKTLKIGGRYTYTDLDELIVNHVKAMARKVDEMMGHEKYQTGSKSETERWLTTYTEANPKRSAYAFCIDPKHPGFFHLCFKAGQHAPLGTWPVKVIPNAFELQRNTYSDMRNLCNGFKTLFQNMQSMKRR